MTRPDPIKTATLRRWLSRLESGAEDIPPIVASVRPVLRRQMAEHIDRLKAKVGGEQ